MDEVLDILSDGQPRQAIQIVELLQQRGHSIPKRLVNSVLFSEARRYVDYDHKSFLYRLHEVEEEEVDLFTNIKIVTMQEQPEEQQLKARFVGCNTEYVFSSSEQTDSALFDVLTKGRKTHVVLNQRHPLYLNLDLTLGNEDISGVFANESIARHLNSRKAIEILLSAWARYESELPDGPRKFKAQEARIEWGRNARAFLLEERDDD